VTGPGPGTPGPDRAAAGPARAGGTEGPAGHEARPPVDDRKVPFRVFTFIGVFILVLGIIYWSTAYEEAGVVMLLVAAVLALWIAVYLWLHERPEPGVRAGEPAGTGAAGTGAQVEGVVHYLPHASAWPFAIGLGAATVANGLVLGLWVTVPGAALMLLGIGGFIRQTRRRD
jgi:Cytochrome c oxidase subunit IV